MESEQGTRLFADSRMHREVVFKGLLVLILNIVGSMTTEHSLIFEGHFFCYNSQFRDLPKYLRTMCLKFVDYLRKYQNLLEEDEYLYDKEQHHRYLRIVACTSMLSIYLGNPLLLRYDEENAYRIDLSPLPWWIKKIIRRLIFRSDFSIDVKYYSYSEIEDE